VTDTEEEGWDGDSGVEEHTVKSVMMKWWRWKHRDPSTVSLFYEIDFGTTVQVKKVK
jgi:hypothetical protein